MFWFTDSFKAVIVLSAVIVVLMLAYSVAPKPGDSLTEGDARILLLNDLAQQGIAGDEIQLFNFTRSDGVWTVDVLITRSPHSKCPTVEKRSYSDVLRFRYRPEQLIKDCLKRSPIILREEAVIDSAELPASAGADYACAFSLDAIKNYAKDEAIAYCPLVDAEGLFSFASGLPAGAWVVQWNKPGGVSSFVALDSFGAVLKTS